MTIVTRPSSFLLVVVSLIITAALVQVSVISTSTTLARSEETGTLLRNYYAVSRLPLRETKVYFRNASSDEKSDLWRIHLALFLVKHPELNELQKEVVLAAMSLATPEFFEIRSTDPFWKTKVKVPLRSLEQRIFSAFSSADATKIFATLGNDTEFTNDIAPCAGPDLLKRLSYQPPDDIDQYKAWTHIRFAGQGKEKENDRDKGKSQGKQTESGNVTRICPCSLDSDYCPVRTSCRAGTCQTTSSGCGTFWTYPCNGSCQ